MCSAFQDSYLPNDLLCRKNNTSFGLCDVLLFSPGTYVGCLRAICWNLRCETAGEVCPVGSCCRPCWLGQESSVWCRLFSWRSFCFSSAVLSALLMRRSSSSFSARGLARYSLTVFQPPGEASAIFRQCILQIYVPSFISLSPAGICPAVMALSSALKCWRAWPAISCCFLSPSFFHWKELVPDAVNLVLISEIDDERVAWLRVTASTLDCNAKAQGGMHVSLV